MKHAIHSVMQVQVVGPWTLHLVFGDGTERIIDFRSVLLGELYGPLNEMALFRQVRVDPEVHTIIWPNGADFDPATLHDWPDYESEWIARARKWANVAEKKAVYGTTDVKKTERND
jgi:hypothetical protein